MNKEQIKEINEHISDGLKQWCEITCLADTDAWSYQLDYTKEDVFNAMYILNHVISNVAIKSGYIKTEEDAFNAGMMLKEVIEQSFGVDIYKLLDNECSTC